MIKVIAIIFALNFLLTLPTTWASETEFSVHSGDVTLKAYSSGTSKNTLILISGGPGASSDYMASLESLAGKNLRVVRFDLRGTGKSSAPVNPKEYSPEFYVKDLEALRQNLGIEKMILLGHSYGGLTAMNYAIAHPTNVAGLILYGSSPTTKQIADPTDKGYSVRQDALIATGVLNKDASPGSYEFFRLFFAPFFFDPYFQLPNELLNTSISDDAAQATLTAFGNYDFQRSVRKLRVPTLIMTGEADPYELGVGATIRTLEKDFAKSRPHVHLIPKCGHLWQECKLEALSIIFRFLSK